MKWYVVCMLVYLASALFIFIYEHYGPERRRNRSSEEEIFLSQFITFFPVANTAGVFVVIFMWIYAVIYYCWMVLKGRYHTFILREMNRINKGLTERHGKVWTDQVTFIWRSDEKVH